MNRKGLYGKYTVQKVDGSQVDPEARYIVLRVDNHGADIVAKQIMRAAAREGVKKFAFEIEPVAPELAADLKAFISKYQEHENSAAHIANVTVGLGNMTIDDVKRADQICKGISCEGCPFQIAGGISCSPEARQIAVFWHEKGVSAERERLSGILEAEKLKILETAVKWHWRQGALYVIGFALDALKEE